MSAGLPADLYLRGGDRIKAELQEYLDECGLKAVPVGSVVGTSCPGLAFKHVIHAVVSDPFEGSSAAIVTRTLVAAFSLAEAFTMRSVSLPEIGTGYGPLTLDSFVDAFYQSVIKQPYALDQIQIVFRDSQDANSARSAFESLIRGNESLTIV